MLSNILLNHQNDPIINTLTIMFLLVEVFNYLIKQNAHEPLPYLKYLILFVYISISEVFVIEFVFGS